MNRRRPYFDLHITEGFECIGNPREYNRSFPALIADWRDKWKQSDFPFLFVQLANFMQARDRPSESQWAALRDVQLRQFAICGQDGRFVWADARIEGDQVVVWSDQIPHPVAVRYDWADNPAGANLYDREGLPASPFRTDDF